MTLIIVDMQNDFFPGGALGVPKGFDILPIVNDILSLPFDCRIATKDWHPQNHVSFAANHNKKAGENVILQGIPQILWPVHCVQGTFGAELHRELTTNCFDKIFLKGTNPAIDSYSTFFDNAHQKSTGLGEYLHSRNLHDLYIAGLATDYCVKYSVLDALKLGFNTFVIVDACAAVNLESQDSEKALKEMREAGAKLINSAKLFEKMHRGGGI